MDLLTVVLRKNKNLYSGIFHNFDCIKNVGLAKGNFSRSTKQLLDQSFCVSILEKEINFVEHL